MWPRHDLSDDLKRSAGVWTVMGSAKRIVSHADAGGEDENVWASALHSIVEDREVIRIGRRARLTAVAARPQGGDLIPRLVEQIEVPTVHARKWSMEPNRERSPLRHRRLVEGYGTGFFASALADT